jgi:hypothetical protein
MDEEFEKELKEIFAAGHILENALLEKGCTESGCVGTCSGTDEEKFIRWMDFDYLEESQIPTQEFLDSITPEGFEFELMDETQDLSDEDGVEKLFTVGVSVKK